MYRKHIGLEIFASGCLHYKNLTEQLPDTVPVLQFAANLVLDL